MPKMSASQVRRKERVQELIRQRYSSQEIADREGYSYTSINKTVEEYAKEIGESRKGKLRPYQPFGLTEDSFKLRARLGKELNRVIDATGGDAYEVAHLTGVSPKDQKAAGIEPHNYNWTIAQIERLSRARNISLGEMLQKVTIDYRKFDVWGSLKQQKEGFKIS